MTPEPRPTVPIDELLSELDRNVDTAAPFLAVIFWDAAAAIRGLVAERDEARRAADNAEAALAVADYLADSYGRYWSKDSTFYAYQNARSYQAAFATDAALAAVPAADPAPPEPCEFCGDGPCPNGCAQFEAPLVET